MSTYKQIAGTTVKAYTTNPSDPQEGEMWYNQTTLKLRGVTAVGAWSSASPLSTATDQAGSGGTKDAAWITGGQAPSVTNKTEEWNGSGWSTGGNLPYSSRLVAGFGTQTAGVATGGLNPPTSYSTAAHYDGSSWTAATSYPTTNYGMGSAGTQTAGIVYAGAQPGTTAYVAITKEYDGSSWTAANSMSLGRHYPYGCGVQTAVLAGQGNVNAVPGVTNTTEEYDGTNWTSGPNNVIALRGSAATGSNTAAISYGGNIDPGSTTTTGKYDGTTWSTGESIANERQFIGSNSTESSLTSIMSGGASNPGTKQTLTEEYNFSAQVITPGAWSSGGDINEARRAFGSCGSNTAGLIFGGRLSPTASPPAGYRGQTEQYDGTSWTEVSDLNNTRSNVGGAGTQTSAVAFGGLNPSLGPRPADNVEEWDGSTWTNATDVPTATENYGSCGIQTAALQYGGSAPPGFLTTTLAYDGSSWTSGGAMNTARNLYNGSGTQTAALGAGGQEPSLSSKTEEYNGTTWSEVNNMNRAAFYNSSTSAPQTDSMSFGSGPSVNYVEKYDGTTWSTAPTLGTSRSDGSGFGTSANGSVMVGGPSGPSTYPSATEEFTGETTAANTVDITTAE